MLAFKEPENEPKTIQFLKILLEKPAPRTAPLSHNTFTFHDLLYSYANLQQKSCLRAFKNASLHSGVWKGNSRDPQFGQNIVRDLRNVNVKRNFTATGLETGLRKFGQGCEM